MAIKEWCFFQEHPISVENLGRCLAAFDMFFLHGEDAEMDMDRVSHTCEPFLPP